MNLKVTVPCAALLVSAGVAIGLSLSKLGTREGEAIEARAADAIAQPPDPLVAEAISMRKLERARPDVPDRHPRSVASPERPSLEEAELPDPDPVRATFVCGPENRPDLAREQVVCRAPGRVYLLDRQTGVEWLFRRNPISPGFFSGRSVDHVRRVVLDFSHADLLSERIAGSWSSLSRLGVDRAVRRGLKPDGRTESAFGLGFVCLVPAEGADGIEGTLSELWWNEQHQLPLRLVQAANGQRFTRELRSVTFAVDEGLLVDPVERYAGYAHRDVADDREDHHPVEGEHEHEHERGHAGR